MNTKQITYSKIVAFLHYVEATYNNGRGITFSYVALRREGEFYLLQGQLMYNYAPLPHLPTFESPNIRAGRYLLSDVGLDTGSFIERLLCGLIDTPDGPLVFSANDVAGYGAEYSPFHPEGLKAQARFNVLRILGGSYEAYLDQPALDWELRASTTPFESLQELALVYKCGNLLGYISVEVVALHVAAVDYGSQVTGELARVGVFLSHGCNTSSVTLGYRIFDGGRVTGRCAIDGSMMEWEQRSEHQYGVAKVQVPTAAVLQCFVSYSGIAQHFGWVEDPTKSQNPRRAAYGAFDGGLNVIRDFLMKTGKGQDARDLEFGVAWLLWMLGFSPAHLGATGRTQDAADIIAVTPSGHVAVVECTTGLLKADNKLPLLIDRTERLRREMHLPNTRDLRVLPVLVTSRTRAEVRADLEQAAKLGIFVLTKEGLDRLISRTLILPNADQVFDEAFQTTFEQTASYDAS